MPTPKDPKDPDEDRVPQRREDLDVDEEADIDETDEEELAEDDMLHELSEDDLKDMEGPDA